MKSCFAHQESLALLAADALPETDPRYSKLNHHLQACAGCRSHYEQMRGLCQRLEEPGRLIRSMKVPSGFQDRWRHRLARETARGSCGPGAGSARFVNGMRAWLTMPRFALAGGLAVCLLLLCVVKSPRDSQPWTQQAAWETPDSAVSYRSPISTKTLFTYQSALRQSPEALEALVAEQARSHQGGEGMTLFSALTGSF